MIAWMTGWNEAWPAITAFSIVSSESSLASDSTISTASAVPATTRSSTLILQLLERRVHDDLVLDVADPRAADRAHERHAGKRQRGRGGDHRENVGIGLHVVAEHGDDHLRVAAEIIGEQRADRAIDQARGERLLVGEPAFALQEAAGNAAGRERLFLVVHGERKEILAGFCRLGGDDGGEHGGLAPGGEHGAVGLAGDAAGFERQLAAAQIEFYFLYVEHASHPSLVLGMRKLMGFKVGL